MAARPVLLDALPAAADAHIHLLLSGGVAGLALHAHGLDVPLAAGTPLTALYEWDFGDPGSRFNTLSGFNAAHLYTMPGSYTVKLTVTDEAGRVKVLHAMVEIARPRRTAYYVSAAGSDSSDGQDPDRPLRSVARIERLLTDHSQVLLRRGDSFPMTSTIHVNHHDVVFGAYSDPAAQSHDPAARSRPPAAGPATHPATLPLAPPDDRPRLLWVGQRQNARMVEVSHTGGDVTLRNLVFDTTFNTDTDSRNMPSAVQPVGTNVAVVHCRFLNVATAVNCELGPTGVLVQDCDAPQVLPDGGVLSPEARDQTTPGVTGLRAYFVWVVGSDVAVLGNTVANSTREHCVRIAGGQRVLVARNDLQNLDREGVDKQDIAKGTVVAQIGDHVYVDHNVLREGPAGVGPLNRPDLASDATRRQDAFSYAVFDGNEFHCPLLLQPGLSHAMVRNNVCRRDGWGAFLINGFDSNYSRDVSDVAFLHNTVINYGTQGNFLKTTGKAEHVTLANNLFVAPNLVVAEGTAPLVIGEPELTSFDAIRNNVWPVPAKISNAARGGVNALSGEFQSPEAWARQPKVVGDRFLPVKLDDQGRPTVAVDVPPAPGAGRTVDGSPRDPARTSAGAVRR